MVRMSSYDIQSRLKDINDYISEKLAHQEGLEDLHTNSSFQEATMKMLDHLIHEASVERAAGHLVKIRSHMYPFKFTNP